jgi:seryl-tRNA synthetase
MHDIKAIRENPEKFNAEMSRRGFPDVTEKILSVDLDRRLAIKKVEEKSIRRKNLSAQRDTAACIGEDWRSNPVRIELRLLHAEISFLQGEVNDKDRELSNILMSLPNTLYIHVPDGKDETDNKILTTYGQKQTFSFEPKEHHELSAVGKNMDFATAAKLSGSRFVVMKDGVARLHRALSQFMLDFHTDDYGAIECNTPLLVKEDAMIGTGQLPKFADDSYQTTNGWWLIPTSEVTMTNFVRDSIISKRELPIRMVAHTQCFRSEAGSAGRDTAGMFRQHQFEKVEMVTLCDPKNAQGEHDRMLAHAQVLLSKLGLHHRTMTLCAGDTGFASQKTYDIEVWLAGQQKYREIASISVCGDFQARRMNARFKDGIDKPEFLATLNGSGVAVGRCLIAVLEHNQQSDGSVIIPEVLHKYTNGKTRLVNGRLE